mgnify:CR=1
MHSLTLTPNCHMCAEPVQRAHALTATLYGTPSMTCSPACLERLAEVWRPTPARWMTARRAMLGVALALFLLNCLLPWTVVLAH